jgi:hypothetical protein
MPGPYKASVYRHNLPKMLLAKPHARVYQAAAAVGTDGAVGNVIAAAASLKSEVQGQVNGN